MIRSVRPRQRRKHSCGPLRRPIELDRPVAGGAIVRRRRLSIKVIVRSRSQAAVGNRRSGPAGTKDCELRGVVAPVFAQARSRLTAFAYIGALLGEPGDRRSC
jgi:hypothetical protein